MSNVDNNGGIGSNKAQVDIRGVGPGGFSSIEDMAAPVSSFRHREMMGEQKHVEAGKMARYFESGSLEGIKSYTPSYHDAKDNYPGR